MKLAKSLLLGSAAALVAGTAAQAADLPYKKAAPVEYVRVCDWTGAGYFYIPGTDTCLKIGGFARADFEYVSTGKYLKQSAVTALAAGVAPRTAIVRGNTIDQTGFLARGRIDADARTQTAYGTLRTYVRYELTKLTGSQTSDSSVLTPGAAGPGENNSGASLDKGFVQFAGITAGRVQSLFDFGADPYGFDGVSTSDAGTNAFSYTATFAGGFTATASVEDPTTRRLSIAGPAGASYSGTVIPDLVGVLRVDQAWGSAQLSGAYHELNTNTLTASKDDNGFAVRGAVLFKLPFLAAGDEFQVEGGYENGAYSYQNSNSINGGYGRSIYAGGYVSNAGADAVALSNGAGGYTLSKSEGYSISGGFLHYITPNVNNIVFGSYDHVEYGSRVRNLAYTAGGIGDTDSYRIADQINWFPVKGLQIGLEVMYIKVEQDVVGTLPVGISKNPDTFVGHFRIERDF